MPRIQASRPRWNGSGRSDRSPDQGDTGRRKNSTSSAHASASNAVARARSHSCSPHGAQSSSRSPVPGWGSPSSARRCPGGGSALSTPCRGVRNVPRHSIRSAHGRSAPVPDSSKSGSGTAASRRMTPRNARPRNAALDLPEPPECGPDSLERIRIREPAIDPVPPDVPLRIRGFDHPGRQDRLGGGCQAPPPQP